MKKSRKQILLSLIFSACLVAADQFAKMAAAGTLKGKTAIRIWPDVLELLYVENRGAAFGMLQQKQALFMILTIIALAAILWAFLFLFSGCAAHLPLNLMLILLFSGALGNFIDRIRQGFVVDFIYFRLIDFPVFNLADCYITISCIGLIFLMLFKDKDSEVSA